VSTTKYGTLRKEGEFTMFGRSDAEVVEDVDERRGHIWSPAQAVALLLGIAAIVLGALGLADTGLDLGDLTEPHRSVQSFHTTPLLALAEIGFGILMVLAGLRPVAGRALMALLGAGSIALGALTVLDVWHHTLHQWLGVHDRNGWLFIAAGAVSLVAVFVLPLVATPGKRITRRRQVVSS
jgi:hypothetical protein